LSSEQNKTQWQPMETRFRTQNPLFDNSAMCKGSHTARQEMKGGDLGVQSIDICCMSLQINNLMGRLESLARHDLVSYSK
jgi:hypothetical protein